MGDKPGKYWNYDECRWVTYPVPADEARVPEQGEPAEATTSFERVPEVEIS